MIELLACFGITLITIGIYFYYRCIVDQNMTYLLNTIKEDVINLHIAAHKILENVKK